jgi:mannose-6-phosphate isomerase class I
LTKERVKELRNWAENTLEEHRLKCGGVWEVDDTESEADLLAALSDYSALKAFKDNLMKDGHANLVRVATHRDALKVENERLNSHLKAATDSKNRAIHRWHTEWTRAEKAEAALVDEQKRRAAIAESLQAHQDELAKQAPLIEAVMGADIFRYEDGSLGFEGDERGPILRAALALREEKGKRKEPGFDGTLDDGPDMNEEGAK